MQAGKLDTIYVELDCLLDTRLGTVSLLDPELAAKLAVSPEYRKRTSDRFEGLDYEVFRKRYKARDQDVLEASMMTEVVMMLRQLVEQLNEQGQVRPYHDGVKVQVNLYPYQLSTDEEHAIELAIASWIGKTSKIELVSMSPAQLTPTLCQVSYTIMVMYEYEDWLNSHAETFKTVRFPEVVLFVPALYFQTVPTEEELEKLIKEAGHPMAAVESLISPIVELKLINPSIFSIIETA